MSRPKQGKGKLKQFTREDIYSRGMAECPLCGTEFPTFRLCVMMQKANEERKPLSYFKGESCPICRSK